MTRTYLAELGRLGRRRVVVPAAVLTLVAAIAGSVIVLAAAAPAGQAGRGGVDVAELSRAGGGTEIFRIATAFAGVLVFVLFVGLIANEFARGTIRTMLLRQPRRVRLLAGKLAALLTFAGILLAVAEATTWVTSLLLASRADVSTAAWTSWSALGSAVTDFGAVLLWVTGYAVFGTTIAVLLRSVPLALAVGVAWAGPFEHLLQNAWSPATRWFPGLLLEAFVGGGSPDVSTARALVTVTVYVALAAAVAAGTFARRDVTA
jgi:hypothetical protein